MFIQLLILKVGSLGWALLGGSSVPGWACSSGVSFWPGWGQSGPGQHQWGKLFSTLCGLIFQQASVVSFTQRVKGFKRESGSKYGLLMPRLRIYTLTLLPHVFFLLAKASHKPSPFKGLTKQPFSIFFPPIFIGI